MVKEIFVDPFIIDKIKKSNVTNPMYFDLGNQKELKALLKIRSDEHKKLLDQIYKTARKILSLSQYKVFYAVFKYGYKIPALARTHHVKRSTYYTHYYRALIKLRRRLIEEKVVKKKNMDKGSKRAKEIESRNWRPF